MCNLRAASWVKLPRLAGIMARCPIGEPIPSDYGTHLCSAAKYSGKAANGTSIENVGIVDFLERRFGQEWLLRCLFRIPSPSSAMK